MSLRDDIARAVEADHPCEDSNCDIVAALKFGEPFVAAWLLSSGTETPTVDATFDEWAALGITQQPEGDMPEGWAVWSDHFHEVAWHCQCSAWNCDPDSERCSNCNAERVRPYWEIVPADDRGNSWAAGADGNKFETEADALAEIPALARETETAPEYWVAVQRGAPC